MPGTGSPEYDALEQRLRADLDACRARYQQSRLDFDRATDVARELGLNTSDGAYALHQATARFKGALQDYHHALKRFTDLVVHGKLPPG